MTEGFIDSYFEKEFIEKIRESVKKQPTGEYVEYWGNGVLKAKLPYKDGKPNGHIHGWYDNGRDAFKGFFTEGVKQGIHITFYRTEEKDHTNQARILVYDELLLHLYLLLFISKAR
jgi:antitoxin component YwqK of YwqJK toxin-antitoxin module